LATIPSKPAATQIAPPTQKSSESVTKEQKPSTLCKPSPTRKKLFQAQVSAQLHQEIKICAAQQNMTMSELLALMWEKYKREVD